MKLIFTERDKKVLNKDNIVKGGVNIFNNLFKIVSKNSNKSKNNKNRYPVIKGSESKEYIKKMVLFNK